jgi:hypothetical protein
MDFHANVVCLKQVLLIEQKITKFEGFKAVVMASDESWETIIIFNVINLDCSRLN